MRKIETIWHHILQQALEKKEYRHTQQSLAKLFGYSLSTVNHALAVPEKIGAIRKESKFFVLVNFTKLLYYWASVRKLDRDIIYQTHYEGNVSEIEGLLPQKSIYACYSAARLIFKEPPADYSKVYFYFSKEDLEQVKQRFPVVKIKESNVFVLQENKVLTDYGTITTLPQTFVDVWNLKDWYGQDFIQAIEKKINAILS